MTKKRKKKQKKKHPRNILSKWAKHETLRRDPKLSGYMPVTRRMTLASLKSLLARYKMVYVKPVVGALGIGVMKVEARGKGLQYQAGTIRRVFPAVASGHASIVKASKGKPYMVQQGIRLAKFRQRPFDIRVMVQRMPRRPWTVTGMAGRLAHPRKIVTNGSQGGTIYLVHVLLPKSRRLISRMRRMGLLSARRLQAVYPGVVQVGLDIAVDNRKRPWILEANTRPDPCPFTKLPSRHMLRRIVRFGAAWGIRYELKCLKARKGR